MPKTIALPTTPQRPSRTAREVAEPARHGTRAGATPHLYIHVPFCFHKCHYCDFYSIVDTRDRQPAFAARLVRELAALAPLAQDGDGTPAPLRTVFVGGGTPTLMAPALWRDVLGALQDHYDLSAIRRGETGTEFTAECNPETATPELFDTLREGGVNRLSIGAQSFHPGHLKTLERWHDPANVGRAVEMARRAGIERVSVDLIFAIPGQTMGEWLEDLRRALELGVEHLSCYALTFEPGTAMTRRLELGRVEAADEDLELDMMRATRETLAAHGLRRYEVSNFARPGRESAHNLAYWRQADWLAAGPSASGHLAGRRWKNAPRLDDYLRIDDRGFAPIVEHEPPEPRRNLGEAIMTGLRLAEGLDADACRARAREIDAETETRLIEAASAQVRDELMTDRDGRWTLTDRGVELTNRVVRALMDAVDP